MGIKINVQSRNDYSYLFSSMNQANQGNGFSTDFLTNYSSIKNGSYGKLMKAYYSESPNAKVKETAQQKIASVSKDDSKTLATVDSRAQALKKTADHLLSTGKDAVLNTEDKEKAFEAVSSFVDQYNSLISAGNNAFSSSINSRTQSLQNTTLGSAKALSKIGVTVDQNQKLSVDKDAFMKADMANVKSVFQGNGSYAYRVSSQSGMISNVADQEAARANTYTMRGSYGNAYNTGNLFNSMF